VELFVNGLPLAVIELKNPAEEHATLWTAFQQLQTYQAEIPSLFAPNAVLVVSDGVEARVGTLTAGWEWFKPWRTIGGEALAPDTMPQLQVVIEGLLAKRHFLDLVRDLIVFEDEGGGRLVKKMAGYHQFRGNATTARSRCWATRRSGPSLASWSRPCATTSTIDWTLRENVRVSFPGL